MQTPLLHERRIFRLFFNFEYLAVFSSKLTVFKVIESARSVYIFVQLNSLTQSNADGVNFIFSPVDYLGPYEAKLQMQLFGARAQCLSKAFSHMHFRNYRRALAISVSRVYHLRAEELPGFREKLRRCLEF